MRKVSFLSALRGADGRSLARAMAILVGLNLFAAGFHLGAMAAGGPFVLCAVAGGANEPTAPGGADHHDCCDAGCVPAPIALTIDRGAVLEPPDPAAATPRRETALPLVPLAAPHATARGPPILA